jgi:diketogulonate reductase-like aldo/keto reductase
MKIKNFTLFNGVEIPGIGFGTWQIANGRRTYEAVSHALKAGYRHIDTALAYGNEESVGIAVLDSGIDRKEIFVTSKLPANIKSYSETHRAFELTLKNTGLDYLDLYLIHAPWPWGSKGEDYTRENIQVWKAMQEIYAGGSCRAVGVSNFFIPELTSLIENSDLVPMVNQIKYHIGRTKKEVVEYCNSNNIVVEGYSPLATGYIVNDKTLDRIANKYKVTVPRLCIRYDYQKDIIPLPKSENPDHMKLNMEIDFVITEEDMQYLDGLQF